MHGLFLIFDMNIDKMIMKTTNYILQGDCKTCQLITLLNACIKHKGYTPLEYDTKKYWQFVKRYPVYFDRETTKGAKKILKSIGATRERFNGHSRDFTRWVKEVIASGGYIDCSNYIHNLHSFLIADYYEETDSYEVINAQIFNQRSPIEVLPMPVILKSHTHYTHTFKYWTEKISVNNIHKASGAIFFK